jgi:hypothetical protein
LIDQYSRPNNKPVNNRKSEGRRDMHLPSNKQQNLANIGIIKVYSDVGFPAFANAGEHSPKHTLMCAKARSRIHDACWNAYSKRYERSNFAKEPIMAPIICTHPLILVMAC